MRDQAIQNALHYKANGSTSDGNMVVGFDGDHVAVAFNQTENNKNSLVVLRLDDAAILHTLLGKALEQLAK